MAHGRPWYKRNGADIVMATLGFPDAEHKWAYSAIIDMLNDRDRPLEDDAGFICGFTGLSRKKWSVVRAYLTTNGYLVANNGRLTNPRFEREREQRRVEHEASVEGGRKGGKRSAEKRQFGLGLNEDQGDDRPILRPDKRPDSTPDSPIDHVEKVQPSSPEINDLAQPPPQATRARERASEARGENHTTDRIPTPPRAALDDRDLKALLDACSDASGYWPTQPTHIGRALDQVRDWRQAGIDFEAVVIPTIRSVIASTNDPTASLKRFDRRIRLEHAKRGAQPKPSDYRPPASPVIDVPGEAAVCREIRTALLARIGANTYTRTANDIRLEPIDGAGGNRRPLKIIDERPPALKFESNPNAHAALLAIAKAHGFDQLW